MGEHTFMIVVFDTNIWKQNLYLRSPAGSAVRLYLKRSGNQIALPEVIRLEVEAHIREDLTRARDQVKSAHDRMLALFTRLRPVTLPSNEQIDDLSKRFFAEIGLTFREVPFAFDAARNSFIRTIIKRAPSAGSQQFKDGVIWANCIELAREDDVLLVTDDKAFYDGDRIAVQLFEEALGCAHTVGVLKDLKALLKIIKSEFAADPSDLIAAIKEGLKTEIAGVVDADELTMGEPKVTAEYFATESPDLIYISFKFSVVCDDLTDEERGQAIFEIVGGCGWNEQTNEFIDIQPSMITLEYLPGSEFAGDKPRQVFAVGAAGRKEVVHKVRHKLD